MADDCRRHKAIWSIDDLEGTKVSSQENIEGAASRYFAALYKESSIATLEAQMNVLQVMPRIFSHEDLWK